MSLPPHPVLMVVDHGETVAHYPLRRRLSVVGRDQRCTLRLADSQISIFHCILYREEGKLWAIDLLSSNGTSIAGQPLQTALVAPGQSLTLGDHLELVYLSTPQMDDNLDELTTQVTSRMIQSDRQTRRRRWLLVAAVGLLILLAIAAAIAATFFLLPKDYLADLWERIPFLGSQDR